MPSPLPRAPGRLRARPNQAQSSNPPCNAARLSWMPVAADLGPIDGDHFANGLRQCGAATPYAISRFAHWQSQEATNCQTDLRIEALRVCVTLSRRTQSYEGIDRKS